MVDSMARNTRLIDTRFADEYSDASYLCLLGNETRKGYEVCMAEWDVAADAVRILIATARALDVVEGRKQFEQLGCQWYRALQVVDATVPVDLPATTVGLESKWKKRCGK